MIPIQGKLATLSNTIMVTLPSWWNYYTSRYSGVQAIYFTATAQMSDPDGVGYIELYHMKIEDAIATFSPTGTTKKTYISADIKEYFDDNKPMVVRAKMSPEADYGDMYLWNASIIIVQDDDTETIVTTSQYYLPSDVTTTTSNSWQYMENAYITPKVGYGDGTEEWYFEVYQYTASGGTSAVRLYDLTAGAAVAGSEVKTTETDWVITTSGALTLVDGHNYIVQIRNETSGKTAYACAGHLICKQSGFTKCVSLPLQYGWYREEGLAGSNIRQIGQWLGAKISAGTISYRQRWYDNLEFGTEDDGCNYKLRNETAGADIEGSTVNAAWQETALHYHGNLTPTMPTTDVEVAMYTDSQYSYGPRLVVIEATMEPAPPTYPYIPVDITKPSGYHAFISNYLANVALNYRPLATPDAVNRLY